MLLLALLLAGITRPATAAEPADTTLDLKGVADATLGVSQLTADGVQCGLDLGQLAGAARQLVVNAGIGLREDAGNRMTISAVTVRVGTDQCATAAMLGVYTRESFFNSAAGWVQSGYVVVWQRSLMVTTPIGQHGAAVVGATRRLTEQMLADWRTENSPGSAQGTPSHGTSPGGRPMAMETRPGAAKTPQ
jgi:hypothetical protein